MYKFIPPLLIQSQSIPHPSPRTPLPSTRRTLLFRAAHCSEGVAVLPLFSRYIMLPSSLWYAVVPLSVVVWMCACLFFCVRLHLQMLPLLLLPLSRWEARNKKGPAWLFDRFKVNNFGNPDQLPNWAKWWLPAQLHNDDLHGTFINI
jgi:hypothetical protein